MFHLLQPNIFPIGDLGVRGGAQRAFKLAGSGKKGAMDASKDRELLANTFAPFAPYRSIASWYMWRVYDTPSFLDDGSKS
jgi:DNA-3-methyladenine glycosylase II